MFTMTQGIGQRDRLNRLKRKYPDLGKKSERMRIKKTPMTNWKNKSVVCRKWIMTNNPKKKKCYGTHKRGCDWGIMKGNDR